LADFYTNISVSGKYILYRGVENDKRVRRKIEFRPTFYLIANEKTDYKTLSGEFVKSIEPGTIPECREFLERYESVDNFPVFGNNRYEYAFIADRYPDDILWDINKVTIAYLDMDSLSQEMPTNQSPPSLSNLKVIILCLVSAIIASTVTTCTMQSVEMNSTLYEDSLTSGQDSTQMWSQDGTSNSSISHTL